MAECQQGWHEKNLKQKQTPEKPIDHSGACFQLLSLNEFGETTCSYRFKGDAVFPRVSGGIAACGGAERQRGAAPKRI